MDLLSYLSEFELLCGVAQVGESLPPDFTPGTPIRHYPASGWRVDLLQEPDSAQAAALDTAMAGTLTDWVLRADAERVSAGESVIFTIQTQAVLGAPPLAVEGTLNGAAFVEALDEAGTCTLEVTAGSGVEKVVLLVDDRRVTVEVEA